MRRSECMLIWSLWLIFGLSTGCGDRKSQKINADTESNTPDAGPDSGTPAPMALAVSLDFGNNRPSAYLITAFTDNGTAIRAFCSEFKSEAPNITCEKDGATLTDVQGPIHLTIKAPGYSFISETLHPTSLEVVDDTYVYKTTLTALPAFEVDESYTTGFQSNELDTFTAMAYRTTAEMGALDSVKFVITDFLSKPTVYFMNTKKHSIHYNFAKDVLGMQMTSIEFWEAAYSGADRDIMAGTVMLYDTVDVDSKRVGSAIKSPFVLTFFPSDNLNVEQARKTYRLIEERLGIAPLIGDTHRFYYLPAGEGQEAALSNQVELFDQWDASWIHRRELYRQKSWQFMNQGIAFGTLRLADLNALEAEAFSFKDILVLPSLPIQLPIVGGTITEEFQTPLSHVNIMAQNRDTPNMTLAGATSNPDITELLGKLVRFEVTNESYTLEETTAIEAETFWATLSKEPITLESDITFEGLPLFDEIGFKDWTKVGAKAANLAELHQLLGDTAPKGFAIPFYYYQTYMETNTISKDVCSAAGEACLDGNRDPTVCNQSAALCENGEGTSFISFAGALLENDAVILDTQLREASLFILRFLIAHGTVDEIFASDLDHQVAEVFGDDRVRLRSSTNTEDIPGFSGAGLYDSESAYAEGEERASSVIRTIWASVWNWRAFEERSFWHIDHLSTRMGIAVNQAFPMEAANGVIITQNIANIVLEGMYVNVQMGEISVTNPEGYYTPEIFSIIRGTTPGTVQAARLNYSSISPNSPIMTDEEIQNLYETALIVQNHFADLYEESPYMLALDMEFKLLEPDRALMIKQVRPYAH